MPRWRRGRRETDAFDAAAGALTPHRAKEEADDYRYFPEPDLVPVEPPAELVERLRSELPELPAARIRRLEVELDLERATVLVTGGLDRLWQETVAGGAAPPPPTSPCLSPNRTGRRAEPGATSVHRGKEKHMKRGVVLLALVG